MPGSQAPQTAGAVEVAGEICTVPAAQAVTGTQLDWLFEDVNVPSAHDAHWRSAMAVPLVST